MTSQRTQAVRLSIQTPILRCKMLVGNTQTLELHPLDAGDAETLHGLACCFYVTQNLINVFAF